MSEDIKDAVVERQLIVFNIGEEEFGFDINDVREIIKLVEITKIPDIEDYFKGIINLRGNVIGVIDLAKKLHMQEKAVDDRTRIIVVEVGEDQVGLLVDEVSEVLRINSDKIEPAPALITNKVHADYISGVGILDDRMIILLDIRALLGEKIIEQLKEISKK